MPQNPRLRIAVWHNLPSGGGKRALHGHVAGLVARGHEVESWCPPTADPTYLPLGDLCSEHVVDFRMNQRRTGMLPHPFSTLSLTKERLAAIDEHCFRCAAEIDAGGFDVLFANTSAFFHAAPIGRHVRVPSVLYLQEPFRALYEALPSSPWAAMDESRGSLRKFARDLIRKYAKSVQVREEIASARAFGRILVNSSYSRESVLRSYGLESRVSYLGIDFDRFRPTGEPRERFVVALGALDPMKGPDRAIRALGTIAQADRPRFLWIGNFCSEGYEAEVRGLARECGVEFELKVRVSDTELVSILSRAAVMLYTPRLEPFGLAPLEANACGTPVVAIAEGGVRESVEDGVNGLLARDADPATLGALVLRLVASPEVADAMGRVALAHVRERWNVARGIDSVERHLFEAVGIASAASPAAAPAHAPAQATGVRPPS